MTVRKQDAETLEPEAKTNENGETPAEAGSAAAAPPVEAPPPAAQGPDAAELTAHLQRLAAEFENYKKRTAREMQQLQESGMARAMEAVLPALDSFAASLAAEAAGHDAQAWRDGLEKIHRQLLDALDRLGLKAIHPAKGEPLDPRVHEVMLAQPSADAPTDAVLQVFQTGYKLKDRLLRPAKVVVAAAPAQPEPEREN